MEDPPDTWLQILCGIPYIGDWVATFVGLLPVILMFMAREFMSIKGDAGPWFMIAGCLLLISWCSCWNAGITSA